MMSKVNIIPKFWYGGLHIWVIGQKGCSKKWRLGVFNSLKSKLLVEIYSNRVENDPKEVLLMIYDVNTQYYSKIWYGVPKFVLSAINATPKSDGHVFSISKIQITGSNLLKYGLK